MGLLDGGGVEYVLGVAEAEDEVEEGGELLVEGLVLGCEQDFFADGVDHLLVDAQDVVEVAGTAHFVEKDLPVGLDDFDHYVVREVGHEQQHLVAQDVRLLEVSLRWRSRPHLNFGQGGQSLFVSHLLGPGGRQDVVDALYSPQEIEDAQIVVHHLGRQDGVERRAHLVLQREDLPSVVPCGRLKHFHVQTLQVLGLAVLCVGASDSRFHQGHKVVSTVGAESYL